MARATKPRRSAGTKKAAKAPARSRTSAKRRTVAKPRASAKRTASKPRTGGGQYLRSSAFAPTSPAVYYDFLAPLSPTRKPTIVMLHGGAHTGMCYLVTADGRPGWAPYFAAHGYPVVVPDWPGSGRSGAVPDDVLTAELVCHGLGELIEHLPGPIVLMTHSMSGAYGWHLLGLHGRRIAAVVGIAPSPPGNIQPEPPVLSRGDDFVEVKGLAMTLRLPLAAPNFASEKFVLDKLIGKSTRFPRAQIPGYNASLRAIAPRLLYQRQNVDGSQIKVADTASFKDKPILIVTGEHDIDHPREEDGRTAVWLTEQGAHVDYRFLVDDGIGGNGHMMMLETNADQIARLIADWLAQAVG
jgi:pimeloyl-ACP methyl ester carboxylesterase